MSKFRIKRDIDREETGQIENQKDREMFRLGDQLALARMKLIRARRTGLCFDPDRLEAIPTLQTLQEWNGDAFNDFKKKVDQARVLIFTILPGIDEPNYPDTLILSSLWGEPLVADVRGLVGLDQEARLRMEGFGNLREFFLQPDTAYVTEREEKALTMMKMVGVQIDETTLTGLETWHALGQEFVPSVAFVFSSLYGRITAPFKGSTTAGWVWHERDPAAMTSLAPDQTRLAFAAANAMASLTMDGIVARVDPEDNRDLSELGALVLRSEHEGILEGYETLAMRALQLDEEESDTCKVQRANVSWLGLEMAWREPLGRIRRGGRRELPPDKQATKIKRETERFDDLVSWEEAISFVTLLGPEHQRPVEAPELTLPKPPPKGILKPWEVHNVRRANDRLGLDPDDEDLARERFAGLCLNGEGRSASRTASPPPGPNEDVHGLWREERRRQQGERHQGPPTLKWNPPVRRETINKRHRDPEDRVSAWGEEGDEVVLTQTWPPRSKRRREGDRERGRQRPDRRRGSIPNQASYWVRKPEQESASRRAEGARSAHEDNGSLRSRGRGRGGSFSGRGRRGRRIPWLD